VTHFAFTTLPFRFFTHLRRRSFLATPPATPSLTTLTDATCLCCLVTTGVACQLDILRGHSHFVIKQRFMLTVLYMLGQFPCERIPVLPPHLQYTYPPGHAVSAQRRLPTLRLPRRITVLYGVLILVVGSYLPCNATNRRRKRREGRGGEEGRRTHYAHRPGTTGLYCPPPCRRYRCTAHVPVGLLRGSINVVRAVPFVRRAPVVMLPLPTPAPPHTTYAPARPTTTFQFAFWPLCALCALRLYHVCSHTEHGSIMPQRCLLLPPAAAHCCVRASLPFPTI